MAGMAEMWRLWWFRISISRLDSNFDCFDNWLSHPDKTTKNWICLMFAQSPMVHHQSSMKWGIDHFWRQTKLTKPSRSSEAWETEEIYPTTHESIIYHHLYAYGSKPWYPRYP
jgi:hypothetical protein